MKIDLSSIDTTQFMVHQHVINGEVCYLIQPQFIGVKWTQQNKIFRSSIWDSEGNPVSLSFPKFTNWGENPQNFPVPETLRNTTIVEKLDGSLLIVSKYKGQYILRTRGTSDATQLDNGAELEIFKQTVLPKLAFHNLDTWNVSILFEWVSPMQKIILNYGDQPDWYLVGIVVHDDYSLWTQGALDMFAKNADLKRPVTYSFPSFEDLMSKVEQWKGKEGVCVYSDNGQTIHKIKSAEYLAKHRFKSEATLENTLEIYLAIDCPPYQVFEKHLIETFDYECFEMVRGFASEICDASKTVAKIVDGIDIFIKDNLIQLPSRKEQAIKVIASYGETNRASFVFARLDGKELNKEQIKKLYWQVLKK